MRVERYELRYMYAFIESISLNEILVQYLSIKKKTFSLSLPMCLQLNEITYGLKGGITRKAISLGRYLLSVYGLLYASTNIENNLWQLCLTFAVDIMLTGIFIEKNIIILTGMIMISVEPRGRLKQYIFVGFLGGRE